MQSNDFDLFACGMPLPGPDFINYALALGDVDPVIDKKNKNPVLISCGSILKDLYKRATYENGFQLSIILKGKPKNAVFISGHLWGDNNRKGPVKAKVMLVGKWPGFDDMAKGQNFCGQAGEILIRALQESGLSKKDYDNWYVTNLVKHVNIDPSSSRLPVSWIKNCMPILYHELKTVKPDFVLCFGNEASHAVISDDIGGVTATQGRVFDASVVISDDINGEQNIHKFKVMTCVQPSAVARTVDQYPDFLSSINNFVNLVNNVKKDDFEKLENVCIYCEEHLKSVVDSIVESPDGNCIALDSEWQGDYPTQNGAWLRTIQFSHKARKSFVVVLRHAGGKEAFLPSVQSAIEPLKKLLTSTKERPVRIIGHNLRADLPWIKLGFDQQLGDTLIKQFTVPDHEENADGKERLFGWQKTRTEGGFDTMLAVHSVQEVAGPSGYKLEVLCNQYCNIPRWDQSLIKWKKDYCSVRKIKNEDLEGYGDCPDEILLGDENHPCYAGWDAAGARELFDKLNCPGGLLDRDQFGNSSRKPFWISMKAGLACLEMEMTGMAVDVKKAEELSVLYMGVTDQLTNKLRKLINWPEFNPRSPHHCRELLFGLGFSGKLNPETGDVLRVSPPSALLLNIKPLTTTSKPVKTWDYVVNKKEQHLYTPSTGKEVLGILIANMPENSKKEIELKNIVTILRNIRFIGSIISKVICPPKLNTDTDEPELDDSGDMVFDKGLISWSHEDNRIRTHIFQTKETGRYSSSRPPLQNISKRRESDYARIIGESYKYPLRALLCAGENNVIVEADYMGAELLMMAIQSGSEKMVDHCLRANLLDSDPNKYDIHSSIAVIAFNLIVDSDEVLVKAANKLKVALPDLGVKKGDKLPGTKLWLGAAGKTKLRDVAKTIVFGIPYGRGDEAVLRAVEEEGVKITIEDAQAVRRAIFETYPELEPYFDECQRRVTEFGWLSNCFGRYRRFQFSSDKKVVSELQRQAGNFPIQSGVADVVSLSLDKLYSYKDRIDANGYKYKIILQIHDAIMFEVRPDCLEWFLGTHDNPGVLHKLMSSVPVYPCDLSGKRLPGRKPYYMPAEHNICLNWGVPISRNEGLKLGIPEIYLPK